MKKTFPYLAVPVCLAFLISCNIYKPFDSKSSAEDFIEAAQKCLHEGNYACAIENYSQLPDLTQRAEKLCIVSVARAGFTLPALVGAFEKKSAKVIGDLANIFIPWSADRDTASDDAKTFCNQFATLAKNDLGVLLTSISAIVHCTIRMAKADVCACTDDTQTTCVPRDSDGKVTAGDLSDNTGKISVSNPGMCSADANACAEDFLAIDTDSLKNAKLDELKAVYEALPPETKQKGAPIPIRSGLFQTL